MLHTTCNAIREDFTAQSNRPRICISHWQYQNYVKGWSSTVLNFHATKEQSTNYCTKTERNRSKAAQTTCTLLATHH